MRLRRLTALAAGAALLGLVASGLVRLFFTDIMTAMTTVVAEAAKPGEQGTPDGGAAPGVAERTSGPPRDPAEGRPAGAAPPAAGLRRSEQRGRSKRPAPVGAPPQDGFAQALVRGVRRLGPSRYEIARSALDLALHNLHGLARWVRVAPALRDGKPIGFRLFAIASDGPIARLGLRDEDILVSINGIAIDTPDRVLGAYGKLKASDNLALGVLRDGQSLGLSYEIR
jgi:membrane-associated protease RseP (regulator of RpoE activity)